MSTERKTWTEEDVNILLRTDLSIKEISAILERSEASCSAQRSRLRKSGVSIIDPKDWTKDEDALLNRPDLSNHDVSRMTGRSHSACANRRWNLNKKGFGYKGKPRKVCTGDDNCPLIRHGETHHSIRIHHCFCNACRRLVRLRNVTWYENNRERSSIKSKEYREANLESISETQKLWRNKNAEYCNAKRKIMYAKRQEKTLSASKNKGKLWTKKEDKLVKSEKFPIYQTALLLGRTYGAVARRRQVLGITSKP